MVLECLGWSKEPREDINFVLEGRLLYTMPTDTNWRSLFLTKMVPVNVILVTLGSNKEVIISIFVAELLCNLDR